MKALITGSLGFVGRYLRAELENRGYEVIGVDLRADENTLQVDLLDSEPVLEILKEIQPHMIFHLAGQANVPLSWKNPQGTVEANVIAAINLMDAVRQVNPSAHLVLVGSSDEYGQLGKLGENTTEMTPVNPQTPYAVSKLAQEQMARVYVRAYGMNICLTRSFNHGGAGQQEGFLIPDFVSGIVRVEKGIQRILKVGNLESKRDFTHVKDIVRAYRLIAEIGVPGEIYNVGSGVTWSAGEILDKLRIMAKCEVQVVQDPEKMRPSDTPVICCDHSKLTNATGWKPELGMDDILRDVLREWREKL